MIIDKQLANEVFEEKWNNILPTLETPQNKTLLLAFKEVAQRSFYEGAMYGQNVGFFEGYLKGKQVAQEETENSSCNIPANS